MNATDNQSEPTIEETQKLAEEYLNGWKRAKADLVNLQNETAKERADFFRFGSARTLERLLPFVDTLYAAAAHDDRFRDIVRKLEEYLKSENIAEIPTSGKYDHGQHEVIAREKKEGEETDNIIAVVQKGYLLHDKVLRPARVIIAA